MHGAEPRAHTSRGGARPRAHTIGGGEESRTYTGEAPSRAVRLEPVQTQWTNFEASGLARKTYSESETKCVGTGLCPVQAAAVPRLRCGVLHKYDYRRILPHIQKDNRPIFVTFATCNRWHLLAEARNLILDSCLQEHGRKVDLHAALVMPDHVHLLFTPLRDEQGWIYSLPDIMRSLKGRAAHNINRALQRSGPVWQEEFFDHVVRCNESLAEKVEYICENPWRAGLVGKEETYPWSWRGKVPVI